MAKREMKIECVTQAFPLIQKLQDWFNQFTTAPPFTSHCVDTHGCSLREILKGHFFSLSLQMSFLLALQTSSLYQHEHPLKPAFLMGVKLPSSPPPQPRLTAAADKACPGWWLDHSPLSITPLAHLSSILWLPSGHCTTVSLHTRLPCSLILSLLSYPLCSSYNQTPLCAIFPLIALMLQEASESSPAKPSHSHSTPLSIFTFR